MRTSPPHQLEAELLLSLRVEHGRVSNERVVSGRGCAGIYRSAGQPPASGEPAVAEAMRQGPGGGHSPGGPGRRGPLCGQVLDLFISLYGAEAGNVALPYLATAGSTWGGIAPKIIEKLGGPDSCSPHRQGASQPLLERVPVHVILTIGLPC